MNNLQSSSYCTRPYVANMTDQFTGVWVSWWIIHKAAAHDIMWRHMVVQSTTREETTEPYFLQGHGIFYTSWVWLSQYMILSRPILVTSCAPLSCYISTILSCAQLIFHNYISMCCIVYVSLNWVIPTALSSSSSPTQYQLCLWIPTFSFQQ